MAIKRKFEVHELKGKAIRTVATPRFDPKKKDKDGNPKLLGGFDYEDKEVDAGWMIYFPSGSSIHVWTEEEMVRQNFGYIDQDEKFHTGQASLVDMETGEPPAPTEDGGNLKARSERKTHVTRSSRAAQT